MNYFHIILFHSDISFFQKRGLRLREVWFVQYYIDRMQCIEIQIHFSDLKFSHFFFFTLSLFCVNVSVCTSYLRIILMFGFICQSFSCWRSFKLYAALEVGGRGCTLLNLPERLKSNNWRWLPLTPMCRCEEHLSIYFAAGTKSLIVFWLNSFFLKNPSAL